jgi:hypothetical protein
MRSLCQIQIKALTGIKTHRPSFNGLVDDHEAELEHGLLIMGAGPPESGLGDTLRQNCSHTDTLEPAIFLSSNSGSAPSHVTIETPQ